MYFDENSLRAERNARLVASDLLLASLDRGLEEHHRYVLETYRIELRESMDGVTDANAYTLVLPVPADPDVCEMLGLPDEHQPVDLVALEVAALAYVDSQAERQRQRFISPGDGQAMSYLRKADQAAAYLQAESPDDADYPWLAGEAAEIGMDVPSFARYVARQNDIWGAVGPVIERLKAATKAAVRMAAGAADADQHSIRKAVITDWSPVDAAFAAVADDG